VFRRHSGIVQLAGRRPLEP